MTKRAQLVVELFRSVGDRWLLTWVALLVASGLTPLASVYVTREIVDHLVRAARSPVDWTSLRPLVMWSLGGAAIMMLMQALQSVLSWVRTVQSELLRDRITARIQAQSARVDLAFYDSPEFFDSLHRARDEASYRPAALLDACGEVLQGGVTLVGMGVVLLTFGWWLPFALFAGALPVLLVVSRYGLLEQLWRRSTTTDERRTWYYDAVLTSRDYAAEVRLFGLAGHFRVAHDTLRDRLRAGRLDLAWRRVAAEVAAATGGIAVTGLAFGWMLWRAVTGVSTLGQLAAFYQAFSQGLVTMRMLLGGLARIHANSLFMEHLFEFLDLEPRVVDAQVPVRGPTDLVDGICFRNVTFRYPNTTRTALSQFNLWVPAGRIVAIVGPNGSGKSTLVKLLGRLYDPDDGAIELDGLDIRLYAVDALRNAVTVLCQAPAQYAQSVSDNIRIGRLRAGCPEAEVRRAAEMAGAGFAAALPDGYDTLLGKRFDGGTELSAGEWQRIALARALLRPSPIVVLDEPTSALDPWAEADWFRRLREAVRGRTTILITHRFTTAMQADTIHVMERGRIVEAGSHRELVAGGGVYAASWLAQHELDLAHRGRGVSESSEILVKAGMPS